MTAVGKSVFLSYASQDAEAALRLGAGLRAAGVEVWLDQEGGLVGGDAWDRKIREQIATCTLFVPVISASTQARSEGYFRLEWKLAAQRTHMMSERVAFLLPVVIDATRDAEADVPAEFRAVQWVRLPGGSPTPPFVEQVKRLLEPAEVARVVRPVGAELTGRATRATPSRAAARWGWVALALCIVGLGLAYLLNRKSGPIDAAQTSMEGKRLEPGGPTASAKSLAVLPFANLSTDKENEFFADGMHDELLTALAKIGALKVISRTSVLAYRDPAKRNLRQIAAELGVAHVLEGSVSRAGGRVRIIVQLIDAATDQHRWAETYNRDISDVFQVQAEISAQIAQALAATISPELKVALARKLTSNSAAYDFYLRGRRWRDIIGELGDTAKVEELIMAPLEKAIALDPQFAAAYAELSQVHSYLYWWPQRDPTPARLAKARAAVDAALRLDPTLPVAHVALGYYHYVGSLDFARATEEYTLALAAMPGDADILHNLAAAQRRQGQWAEATVNLERAFAIDPRNAAVSRTLVECLVAQRYYARAEQAVDKALLSQPATELMPWFKAQALWFKAQARFARDGDRERYRSARAAIPRSWEAEPPDPRIRQFEDAMEDGQFATAVRIFDDAPERFYRGWKQVGSHLPLYLFAAAAMGEREKARERALGAIAGVRAEETERRDEYARVARLALLTAYAGQPGEARRLARRALELMPITRDAVSGPTALLLVAEVHLALGERDRALTLLDQAMSVPYSKSAHEVRLEPWWAPLRDDPRFEAALAKAAPRD